MTLDPAAVVAFVLLLIGAMVLAVGGFRSRIRDDTISSQKGYIEQLERERENLRIENSHLRERDELRTADWGKEVGQHVAGAINLTLMPLLDQMSAALRKLDERVDDLEKRRDT